MSAIRQHAFVACNHPGNHGYGPVPAICETCRNGERDKAHAVQPVTRTITVATIEDVDILADALHDLIAQYRRFNVPASRIKAARALADQVDAALVAGFAEAVKVQPVPHHTANGTQHTVNGQTSENGWPYGTTHDMDCPGCRDIPFTASPRSETYWSS